MAVTDVTPEGSALLMPGDAVKIDATGKARLIGGSCASCGTKMYPKAPVCPSCMSAEVAEEVMPDKGTLYSYSILAVGPAHFDKPVKLGYVDLPNGVRVLSHLRGEKLTIDKPVRMKLATVGHRADGVAVETFIFEHSEE